MTALRTMLSRLWGFVRNRRHDRILEEELRFHLEMEIQENLDHGMNPEEARYAARRSLGGIEQIKESHRDRRGIPQIDRLFQDMRYGVRVLAKNPGFTTVVVLTLALGIGCNTAIFSLLNELVLRGLPYPASQELVRIWPEANLSKAIVVGLEEELTRFDALSAYAGRRFALTGMSEAEELVGMTVLPSHLTVLGTRPVRGRDFLPEERRRGAEPVAIISHGLWQRRFGGDSNIVGRSVELDGADAVRRTIIGVLPADHRPLVRGASLWVPLVTDEAEGELYFDNHYLGMVGRLSTGVSLEQAAEDIRRVAPAIRARHPAYYSRDFIENPGAASLNEVEVGNVRPTLLLLLGAVGLVLMIACTNVAGLLLARSTTRTREIAIRAALGAGRARIVRQLMTESAILGILGGGAGLLLAGWLPPALSAWLPGTLSASIAGGIAPDLEVDGTVLWFTVGLSLLSTLMFGLVPALWTTRIKDDTLRYRGGGYTPGRPRLNGMLVIAQIALSVVLVVGAGLMVKSSWQLQQVDAGFNPENLLTLRLTPSEARYGDGAQQAGYYRQIREQVLSVPGIVSVGATNLLPLRPGNMRVAFMAEDNPIPPGGTIPNANYRVVTPDYFPTMGIPLLEGRMLDEGDRNASAPVAVINAALRRQLWPGSDPIGKLFHWEGDPWFTVVGVVGDIRQVGLHLESSPEIYRPLSQEGMQGFFLTLRTRSDPMTAIEGVKNAIWSVDEQVPISFISSMRTVIELSTSDSRNVTTLLAIFAGLALFMGMIGVFGVVSYWVRARTREIGVRLALGARPGTIMRSILAVGLRMTGIGLLAGLPAGALFARFLENRLFGVSPTDPAMLATVGGLLGIVTIAASLLPAVHASKVDPLTSLRHE